MDILALAEVKRRKSLAQLDVVKQAEMGQFFTPLEAARTMASLLRLNKKKSLRILDPGAGSGILTTALVQRIRTEMPSVVIHVTAVEVDVRLAEELRETLKELEALGNVSTALVDEDFIDWALRTDERFDLVIQNPPYKKLQSSSRSQEMLRKAGIVVPNVYAAFLALGLRLLVSKGQQVSITPRSWMNGTYYSAFRQDLLSRSSIDAIHTFESRSKVFGDTGVLQETIVVVVTVDGIGSRVQIHTSHDHQEKSSSRVVAYSDVVTSDFIHVPASEFDSAAVRWMQQISATLTGLGLTVSTGRLVDFRSRENLFFEQIDGAYPLVSPLNLKAGKVVHPLGGARKPQWFYAEAVFASKVLVPPGSYVVIKRFSTKEEKRRIVASVWSSKSPVAFDNKLNYIHASGQGLAPEIAQGIATYMNSTQVDDYFRVFSGHTQVNATDLRQVPFPTYKQLAKLGGMNLSTQALIDDAVEKVLQGSGKKA